MTTDPSNIPRRHYEWRIFPAAAVIAIGVLFLLGNLGYRFNLLEYGNWWAWFILVAALAPLTRAYEVYRARGRIDGDVVHFLLAATAVTLVAVMFLLNLDWGVWWPLFVILGGLFTLVRRPYSRRYRHRSRYSRYGSDDDADDTTIKR